MHMKIYRHKKSLVAIVILVSLLLAILALNPGRVTNMYQLQESDNLVSDRNNLTNIMDNIFAVIANNFVVDTASKFVDGTANDFIDVGEIDYDDDTSNRFIDDVADNRFDNTNIIATKTDNFVDGKANNLVDDTANTFMDVGEIDYDHDTSNRLIDDVPDNHIENINIIASKTDNFVDDKANNFIDDTTNHFIDVGEIDYDDDTSNSLIDDVADNHIDNINTMSSKTDNFVDEENNTNSSVPRYTNMKALLGFTKMKTLLWYDTHEKTTIKLTTKVGFSQCKYKNCQYKNHLSRQNHHLTKPFDADAILIQSSGIWELSPPPRRDENQVFVLAVRDSFSATIAAYRRKVGLEWLDVFNWTMTFRLDSDIVFKYANVMERTDKASLIGKRYDRIFEEKEKGAVWFVSHCRTHSHRENYVHELRQVMGVDIFGRCGQDPPCPKGSHKKNIDLCFEQMTLKYKFYLAFENTLVEDYVTEKVYRWFGRDIVLVVRGGSNYSRILPPGTVIDAGDFKSATELGKFLTKLANDKERYLDYLRRKDNYYITSFSVPAQEANCKLCEYLNNLDSNRKTYSNVIDWWLQGWRNWGIRLSQKGKAVKI